jgi:hypothetical protein
MERYWNYKSAVTCAAIRGALFFAANVSAGWEAATGAFFAEFALRACMSGFYGALTQRIGRIEPERRAIDAAPAIGHVRLR